MRHENSVFHGLLQHIDWLEFDRLVDKHSGNYRVRRLPMKSQFICLLFGQFAGSQSLRDIETALSSHEGRLYHIGANAPARSTLADANASRPWEVYAELFAHMVRRANRSVRRKMGDGVRLIDATKIKLNWRSSDWARFSSDLCAAKLHIVYDPQENCPRIATVTPDNVNDITPAKTFEIEPGATYVFDLAYYDFGWWHELHTSNCRFVTRLKKHSKLSDCRDRPIKDGSNIVSDRIGYLSKRVFKHKPNPFADPVREICLRRDDNKMLRLVTNDLKAPAEEIADLYKQRWQIELFFKWVKQNLKIKRFLGTSQNAVRTQLFVALIAFMILNIAQKANSTVAKSMLTFTRLIRINIMHRRQIDGLHKPRPPIIRDARQAELELC